jgi:hypothetical protein
MGYYQSDDGTGADMTRATRAYAPEHQSAALVNTRSPEIAAANYQEDTVPLLRITSTICPLCGEEQHTADCSTGRALAIASAALADADQDRADAAWFALHPWMPWRERPPTPEERRNLRTQGVALLPGARIRVARP